MFCNHKQLRNEQAQRGTTMVEACLIVALLAAVCILAIPAMGTASKNSVGCVGVAIGLANEPNNPDRFTQSVVCRGWGLYIPDWW